MPCTCARCTGTGRPDPVYGYDLDAVPAAPCLTCGEPIGAEPYREYRLLARFGCMFVLHERCDTRSAAELHRDDRVRAHMADRLGVVDPIDSYYRDRAGSGLAALAK